MKPRTAILILAALVLLGCNLSSLPFLQAQPTPAGTIRPRFTNHPAPTLKADYKSFEAAGCKADEQGSLRCPPNLPPFDQFGCFELAQAPGLLGGLKPAAPLMICTVEPQPDAKVDPNSYIYQKGCLQPIDVRYVAYLNGQFRLIKNLAELKQAFGPIESPEEALSYALAATGFQAYYGLKDENYRYRVAQVEDTFVLPQGSGFDVLLYEYDLCGCGPHATNTRLVRMTAGGDLDVNDPQPVWEDPAQDDLCVD